MMSIEPMRQLCRLREGKIERALRECVRCRDELSRRLHVEQAALLAVEAARQARVDCRMRWREAIMARQHFSPDERNDYLRRLARLDAACLQARNALDRCVAARLQAQQALETARAALASRRRELEQASMVLDRLKQQRLRDAQVREEGEQDEAALLSGRGMAKVCLT